jgi:hypothetical protein
MTRFDASAWVGMWPFTMSAPTSLQDLVVGLEATTISGAAVSPLAAVLAPESMTANLALIDDFLQAAPVDFDLRLVPVLDPSLPGWESDLDGLLSEHASSIGAVKIVPNYHGYDLEGMEAVALTTAVTRAGLGLCVQVRMLDERAHHPLMKVPGVSIAGVVGLSRAVPDARILACGMFQSELADIVEAPNVSAELSSIESGDVLAKALAVLGEDRIMLGTHAPIYYPATGVAKVVNSVSTEDTFGRVASANARAFFG